MRAIRPRKTVTKSESVNRTPAKSKTVKVTKHLTIKPRASEKAYALSEQSNTYVFDVGSRVNKLDVAVAVSTQYNVDVTGVRLASVPGKTVRIYREKGRRYVRGRRSAIRKAYVTLREGDKLPVFAAVEEQEAPKETK